LTCTPYHKFYIRNGGKEVVIKEAQELLPGDLLEQSEFPRIDGSEIYAKDNR